MAIARRSGFLGSRATEVRVLGEKRMRLRQLGRRVCRGELAAKSDAIMTSVQDRALNPPTRVTILAAAILAAASRHAAPARRRRTPGMHLSVSDRPGRSWRPSEKVVLSNGPLDAVAAAAWAARSARSSSEQPTAGGGVQCLYPLRERSGPLVEVTARTRSLLGSRELASTGLTFHYRQVILESQPRNFK